MPQIRVRNLFHTFWADVSDVTVFDDGYIASFSYKSKFLILKRSDIPADDLVTKFQKTLKYAQTGWKLGGPDGAMFGGAVGLLRFFNSKGRDGYYDFLKPHEEEPFILGKLHISSENYRP